MVLTHEATCIAITASGGLAQCQVPSKEELKLISEQAAVPDNRVQHASCEVNMEVKAPKRLRLG